MRRLALLTFAVCVVLTTATGAVPATSHPAPPAPTADIDTRHLVLDSESRTGFASHSLDIASAVAMQQQRTTVRLNQYAFESAFETTSSTAERREMLFEAVTQIEIEISSLQDRERELRADYVNGSMSSTQFVRELAVIERRAVQLQDYLASVEARTTQVPRISIDTRIRRLETNLLGLAGPVRRHTGAAISGQAAPVRLYTAAGTDGIILSMIVEDEYTREAYRTDKRSNDLDSTFDLDQAVSRSRELYPEAFNESVSTGVRFIGAGIYQLDVSLESGSLTAYLDSDTRDSFFEIQSRDLLAPTSEETAIATANNLRLAVNRTYAGGPMRIAVTNNATGDPVAAPVHVAGDRLQTNDQGILWTLGLPDRQFTVTAVGPAGNVTATVRPIDPRPVGTNEA